MRQAHELGEYLRFRYDTFISEEYSQYETYAMSSDRDRTILSGIICLASFYASKSDRSLNLNSNLTWNPVPIRTILETDDNVN